MKKSSKVQGSKPAKTEPDMLKIKKMYDQSFQNHKKAWRHLVSATENVGWKDIYFMVLKLQELTNDSGYKLRRSPNL